MAVEQIVGAEKEAILKRYAFSVAAGRKKVAARRKATAKTKARTRKRRVPSGLRQQPRKKSSLTPTQQAEFTKVKAGLAKKQVAEAKRIKEVRTAQNEARKLRGEKPLRELPPLAVGPAGVKPGPEFTRIYGIPEAKPPTIFKQEYTGPSSPPAQERPLPPFISARPIPGIPGSIEAVTGKQMEDILTAAGIPIRKNAATRSISSRSALDPYAIFFS